MNSIQILADAAVFNPNAAFTGIQDQLVGAVTAGGPYVATIGGALLAFGIVWRFIKRAARG